MSTPSLPPALPAELERDIFELTARIHKGSAVRLILVARRVQIWIEPIIYEVLVLQHTSQDQKQSFVRTFRSKPSMFFAQHVKHLCVPYRGAESQDTEDILSACSGILDLAYWSIGTSPQIQNLVGSRNLTRLSISLDDIFGLGNTINFKLPVFTNLTHLDLVDSEGLPTQLAEISLIPKLSHLAFNDSLDVDVTKNLLAKCKSLQILVLICHIIGDHSHDEINNIHDPRAVAVWCGEDIEDWKQGAFGQPNLWTRAEMKVAKQQAGAASDCHA